jgi:hypothetical protein
MKLYETLPDRVRIGKRIYKCDFEFRNVLRMMEYLDNQSLIGEASRYLALKCIMKHPPRDTAEAVSAVLAFLFGNKKKRGEKKRVTSFEQDAGLIRAAFLQVYGVDLWTEKLHWFKFRDLLDGLPEGTRYNEIVSIRARPLPKATKYNAEERQWLMRAKEEYALEMTEEQQERTYSESVLNVFKGLMSMAKG